MHILASLRRWPSQLQHVAYIMMMMFLVFAAFPASHGATTAAVPEGVWLIDEKVAVQIFDCGGLLCGRILWLQIPRDSHGDLNLDKNNPNPALQHRGLCGLSIFWGLRSIGVDRWAGGWFYNPDDGKTYNISAEVRSADTLVARIYAGVRLLGKTKILHRVPHGASDGWC